MLFKLYLPTNYIVVQCHALNVINLFEIYMYSFHLPRLDIFNMCNSKKSRSPCNFYFAAIWRHLHCTPVASCICNSSSEFPTFFQIKFKCDTLIFIFRITQIINCILFKGSSFNCELSPPLQKKQDLHIYTR